MLMIQNSYFSGCKLIGDCLPIALFGIHDCLENVNLLGRCEEIVKLVRN